MRAPTKKRRQGRGEYGVEDDAGNTLVWPSVTTKGAARDAAGRLAERRGESVYLFEVGEDNDGVRIVVDREEVAPPRQRGVAALHHETKKMAPAQLQREETSMPRKKTDAQIKREVDEMLASGRTSGPGKYLVKHSASVDGYFTNERAAAKFARTMSAQHGSTWVLRALADGQAMPIARFERGKRTPLRQR